MTAPTSGHIMIGFHAGLMAAEARPLPPRNGGLPAGLKSTGSLSQIYPDCLALGCSERCLSSPPIFHVLGSPAVISFQSIGRVGVSPVPRAVLGAGVAEANPSRSRPWPMGLMLSRDNGAPFPWGSPALSLVSASIEHLPSTRPCAASGDHRLEKR